MPRPKRTKIAPTAPIPQAQRTTTATSTPPGPRHQSKTGASHDNKHEDSTLWTSKLRAQDSAKAPRKEAMMSGGVKPQDVQTARRRRGRPALKKAVETVGQIKALENLKKRRDEELGKKGKDAEVEVVPSTAEQQDEPEDQEEVIRVIRRITPDGIKHSQTAAPRMSSRKETSPPESAMRVRKTPAIDSSVLALANFKRRPRQPSILRMVQQSANRRAASSVSEEASDELEDLEPDDESTPLNVRVSTEQVESEPDAEGTPSEGREVGSSGSRKRKYVEDGESDVQVPRSSPPVSVAGDEPDARVSPSQQGAGSDDFSLPEYVEVEATQEEFDHQRQQQEEVPQDEEEIYSATMAPPRSSSIPSLPSRPTRSIVQQPQHPSIQDPRHPKPTTSTWRKRPLKGKRNASDIENATDNGLSSSSDDDAAPPTTSKARSTTAKRGADSFPPAFSTAHLQSLLPQRRPRARRQYDAFDIPSSSERDDGDGDINSEDDELQHPVARRRQRKTDTAAQRRKKKATLLRGNRGKQVSRPTGAAAQSSTTKRYSKRTYTDRGTGTLSDKENHDHSSGEEEGGRGNEGEGGEDGDITLVETSAELQKVVDKFKEVDEWEMEFESVTVEGHRSSSPRWR